MFPYFPSAEDNKDCRNSLSGEIYYADNNYNSLAEHNRTRRIDPFTREEWEAAEGKLNRAREFKSDDSPRERKSVGLILDILDNLDIYTDE